MPRVRSGAARHRRKKKVMQRVKGQYSGRHRLYRTALEARMRSDEYAFFGRKQKKRDFRRMWIIRINAALDDKDISYSRFMDGLKKANVNLNRKALSELAISDPEAFGDLIETAKKAVA
jgi:large subunit ribosomal protein L20